MHVIAAWREHQHMQSSADKSERLKALFRVILTDILDYECTGPVEASHHLEGKSALTDILRVLGCIVADTHQFIVYTYIQKWKAMFANDVSSPARPARTLARMSRLATYLDVCV